MRSMDLINSKPIHVINDDKFIYVVESFYQCGGNEHCLVYNLELVAGYDYIDPDWSDRQGYVSKENFTERVQDDSFTVYPMHESLKERLEDEGYKEINIEDYTIHPSTIEA